MTRNEQNNIFPIVPLAEVPTDIFYDAQKRYFLSKFDKIFSKENDLEKGISEQVFIIRHAQHIKDTNKPDTGLENEAGNKFKQDIATLKEFLKEQASKKICIYCSLNTKRIKESAYIIKNSFPNIEIIDIDALDTKKRSYNSSASQIKKDISLLENTDTTLSYLRDNFSDRDKDAINIYLIHGTNLPALKSFLDNDKNFDKKVSEENTETEWLERGGIYTADIAYNGLFKENQISDFRLSYDNYKTIFNDLSSIDFGEKNNNYFREIIEKYESGVLDSLSLQNLLIHVFESDDNNYLSVLEQCENQYLFDFALMNIIKQQSDYKAKLDEEDILFSVSRPKDENNLLGLIKNRIDLYDISDLGNLFHILDLSDYKNNILSFIDNNDSKNFSLLRSFKSSQDKSLYSLWLKTKENNFQISDKSVEEYKFELESLFYESINSLDDKSLNRLKEFIKLNGKIQSQNLSIANINSLKDYLEDLCIEETLRLLKSGDSINTKLIYLENIERYLDLGARISSISGIDSGIKYIFDESYKVLIDMGSSLSVYDRLMEEVNEDYVNISKFRKKEEINKLYREKFGNKLLDKAEKKSRFSPFLKLF